MNNKNPDENNENLTLEQKIDKIYISVEKTRKYIWWAFVITVLAVVLPLIGLIFAIPSFLSQINQATALMH